MSNFSIILTNKKENRKCDSCGMEIQEGEKVYFPRNTNLAICEDCANNWVLTE